MEELIDAKTATKITEENAKKECNNYGEPLKQKLIEMITRHIKRGEPKAEFWSQKYIYCLDDLVKKQIEKNKEFFTNKGYSFEYKIINYNDFYHYIEIDIKWNFFKKEN